MACNPMEECPSFAIAATRVLLASLKSSSTFEFIISNSGIGALTTIILGVPSIDLFDVYDSVNCTAISAVSLLDIMSA
jgi:hypothetical protein